MKCKLPDHSLITATVTSLEQIEDVEEKVEMKYPKAMKSKKYNLSKVDHNFMNDDHNQMLLNELINETLVSKEQQNDFDTLYAKFHSIVIQEVTNKLCMNMSRHKRKHKKPYWSETLNSLWKDMRSKEQCLSNPPYSRNNYFYFYRYYLQINKTLYPSWPFTDADTCPI